MLDTLRMLARYAGGLREFLQHPLTEQECFRMVRNQLDRRQETFLQILEHGVYENPRSPYRRLLEHAGIQFPDAAALVARHGVEGALEELYDRGVYLTLEEFKTRKPIRRPGLELRVRARDFDNPLLTRHYESRTGGSRGVGTRLVIDLDLLTYEAAHVSLFLSEFGLAGRPTGLWRETPPGLVGMKTWLRHAKIGRLVERWFTQRKQLARLEDCQFYLFTRITGYLSRFWGLPMPQPECVALLDARRIAEWLAGKKQNGQPALLDTNASTGARVCIAAKEAGLDIAGTFFRFSAEPYTAAKARLVEEAGCRAASFYSAGEIGHIGLPCGNPAAVDEVHLMTDKVGMIERPKQVGGGGLQVGALLFTTLLPSCPKILLNVESGDYALTGERRCGCLLHRMGFHRHLHEIRSFEKLNSAGVTFLGTELIALVEEVLPARFGGTPIDYQFVEEEEDGLPKVSLVVSPRLATINEQDVVNTVLAELRGCPGGGLMSDVWREGKTLRVVRREPYSTGAFKLLPLHILVGRASGPPESNEGSRPTA